MQSICPDGFQQLLHLYLELEKKLKKFSKKNNLGANRDSRVPPPFFCGIFLPEFLTHLWPYNDPIRAKMNEPKTARMAQNKKKLSSTIPMVLLVVLAPTDCSHFIREL